eukprot:s4082_g2.t1
MPGLTNWRHLQHKGLECQPQQHNATTNNNSQQRNHDAMTNGKARLSARACLLPNKGTTIAGPPPAPTEQSTARLAGIRARQLAILAITSFSAALPPEVLRGPQLRSFPLYAAAVGAAGWEEIGMITIVLGIPSPEHVALVLPEQLPAPTRRRSHDRRMPLSSAPQLGQMRQEQQRDLHVLTGQLASMQRCLDALLMHAEKLTAEKDDYLAQSDALQERLRNICEPNLTDLDVEVQISIPGGYRRFCLQLLSAEQRWRTARDSVISQWADFQALRKELDWARRVEQQFREFKQVREEQKKVLAAARARAKEVQAAGAACSRQAQVIEELKGRIQQASQHPKVELQLELGREQQKHDILVERSEQLDLVARRVENVGKVAKAPGTGFPLAGLAGLAAPGCQHAADVAVGGDPLGPFGAILPSR